MPVNDRVINFENCQIIHRNFAGEVDPNYNKNGDREFSLILQPEMADQLQADGWNVKRKRPINDPQAPELIYTSIKVAFGKFPPRIYMVCGENLQTLTEAELHILDNADIIKCDLTINPYHWTRQRESGVKGYLKIGYFTIREEPFAEKYKHLKPGGRV